MTFASIPWLELAIAVPLVGAVVVSRLRDPLSASRWSLTFTGLALACSIVAWIGFLLGLTPDGSSTQDILPRLFGRKVLLLDVLSAPLVPLVALLHFLTVLGTARTKMSRISFSRILAGEAIRLATFACAVPFDLSVLLILGVLLPYFELRERQRPTRVYLIHMGMFVGLLVVGLATSGEVSAAFLMGAVLVRSGTILVHVWVTDLFENASFATALLAVVPITGMYAALRLVLPVPAPNWVLQGIGAASMITAVYAAGMAVIQTDARRFFAFVLLSHSSLVLVGMELHTIISLTGALALWGSVIVSIGGFGLTLRALEARYGRLSLTDFCGLYATSPALAVCFLLTGLASVGFPGTSGFVAAELLVDGAVSANPVVGFAVIVTAALNGVAVLRAYFLLFTGARHQASVPLRITIRERVAVLTLTALILGGGFFPQVFIASSHRAAEASAIVTRAPGE